MTFFLPPQKRINVISIFPSPNHGEIERTLNFQLSHNIQNYNQNNHNPDILLTPKKNLNLSDRNFIFQSRNMGDLNYGFQENGNTNFCRADSIIAINQVQSNNNLLKFTANHFEESRKEEFKQINNNSPINTLSQKKIVLNEVYKKSNNNNICLKNILQDDPQRHLLRVQNELQIKKSKNNEEKNDEDNFTDISLAENNLKRIIEKEGNNNRRGIKSSKSMVPKEEKSNLKNETIKNDFEKNNFLLKEKIKSDYSNEKIIYNFQNFDDPIKKASDSISGLYTNGQNSKHSKNISFFSNSPIIYKNEQNLFTEEKDSFTYSPTVQIMKNKQEKNVCFSSIKECKSEDTSNDTLSKNNYKQNDSINCIVQKYEKLNNENRNSIKLPQTLTLPRLKHSNNILLCHDSHAKMINYYCESNKIGVCYDCLPEFNKENLNFIDIKDYISKYQEKLTKLISISNHIVEHLAFDNQAAFSKDKLIQDINQKFNDFIKALESCREIIICMIKKRFEILDKNSQSMVAEISEELIQKSNELRKAMISKKYIDLLSILREEDVTKKEETLLEIDESLKILREEELETMSNNISIPNFDLHEYLKKISFKFEIGGFSPSLKDNTFAKNLDEIFWENNSKVFTHNYTDKLCTFSANLAILQNCIVEIKINKLSSSRIIAIGLSNIRLKLNYGMLGYDFGPHQIAIFPNKIIGERGKIINSGIEYFEGDIIYIIIKNNGITFRVNTSKLSYTCKECRPPYFLCGTLFNRNDEVEIINIKSI